MEEKDTNNFREKLLRIFKEANANHLPFITNDQICSKFEATMHSRGVDTKGNVTNGISCLAKEGLIVKPEESIRRDGSLKQDGKWRLNVDVEFTDEESVVRKIILKTFEKLPNQELDIRDLIKEVKSWPSSNITNLIKSTIDKTPEINKVGKRHCRLV